MKALVYSKNPCPYCDKAIALLKEKGVTVSEKKIGRDITLEAFKLEVDGLTGKVPTTVPQIFIDEVYIGGHDDLVAHYNKPDLSDVDFSDFDI